jgi:hypothetical protein
MGPPARPGCRAKEVFGESRAKPGRREQKAEKENSVCQERAAKWVPAESREKRGRPARQEQKERRAKKALEAKKERKVNQDRPASRVKPA